MTSRHRNLKRLRRVTLLIGAVPLLQIGGCAILGNNFAEQVIAGTVFNPLAQSLYTIFFNAASGM